LNRRFLILFAGALAMTLPPSAFGESAPPTTDYSAVVDSVVNSLISQQSGAFLSLGQTLLTSFGVILFAITGARMAMAASGHHFAEVDMWGLVRLTGTFVFAEFLLRYYVVPMPWSGSSVHQLLPDGAQQLSAFLNLSALNALLTQMNSLFTGLVAPNLWNVSALVGYCAGLGLLVIMQGLLFAVNMIGIVGLALGILFGPLLIPFMILPSTASLFRHWLSFMINVSMYRVLAAALTFIWANVLVSFIQSIASAGDFGPETLFVRLPVLVMFTVAMGWSCFKIPSWTGELFGHVVGVAQQFSDSATNAIKKRLQ